MAGAKKKLPLKRPLEPRHRNATQDVVTPRQRQMRSRLESEVRSKFRNDDWHVQSRAQEKGRAQNKGRAIATSPRARKRSRRQEPSEDEPEEEEDSSGESSDEDLARTASESSEKETDDDDEDTIVLEKEPTPPPRRKRVFKKEAARKQVVWVDKRGMPWGKEASYVAEDVKLFAKQMNPCYGWADQPLHEKQRFYERLYADWEVKGDQTEINPSWFLQFATKTLINYRHNLCKMIDAGEVRPADVSPDVWAGLQDRRNSQQAQKKSEQMRAILKGKGSKVAQMASIEKTMIGALTLRLNRIPYPLEVQEATEEEYNRRQAEARRGALDYGSDIADMRATTSEIGGRLSHLEDMIRSLMSSLEGKTTLPLGLSTGGTAARRGRPLVSLDVGEGVKEDETAARADAMDVGEDAGDKGLQSGPVDGETLAYADAHVDFLVDGISDAVAEKDVNEDLHAVDAEHAAEDVEDGAAEDVDNDVLQDAIEDAVVSTVTDGDPYALQGNAAPDAAEEEAGVEAHHGVTNGVGTPAPSAGASKSNRVLRNMPTVKSAKFDPPAKSTKGAAAKAVKPFPAKSAEQAKKAEGARKK